jgi:hypothetical protein
MLEIRNFVVGVIGKERTFRIHSTSSQRTVTGNKHPMVAGARKAHEELFHLLSIGDSVKGFAVKFQKLAVNLTH